ncbi:MAG: F0F1 ATP synthase subunit B [Christensenellaceae bacterium]|jgi:F-type H+-transporting ATPase subunit b|nr:F0F1 ATP synthase subunit B [Christensenellaceae bacterium]
MDLHPVDIVLHIINIGVLYFVLTRLLYNPVRKFMDARAARVAGDLEHAALASAQADQLKASYDAQLATAQAEVDRLLLEGSHKAHESVVAITDQAHKDARAILDAARAEAAQEQTEAVGKLKTQIAGMAVDIATQMLGREVRQEDNDHIIDAFFEQRR